MTRPLLLAPAMLLLLALVPLVRLLFRFEAAKRSRDLKAWSAQQGERVARRHAWRQGGFLAALVCIAVALARPAHNPRPQAYAHAGRDVIFVLDVSRSMLVSDISPSRLRRACHDIERTLDTLQGERVALVLFAGSAGIRCPLTGDYHFLRTVLREVGPHSVAQGSTYLQAALDKVSERVLTEARAGFQDVVLMTDGEDQGSQFQEAVGAFTAAGARLLVLGYGEPAVGGRIPAGMDEGDGFVMHKGREVWSRLREDALQQLAAGAGGTYVRAGSGTFFLDEFLPLWSADAPRQFLEQAGGMIYDEWFQWPLGMALLCLLLPALRRPRAPVAAALAALLCTAAPGAELEERIEALQGRLAGPVPSAAQRATLTYNLGVLQMRSGRLEEAVEIFHQAASAEWPLARRADFNRALCQARQSEAAPMASEKASLLEGARAILLQALLREPGWGEARTALEVLTRRADEVERQLEEEEQERNQASDSDESEEADWDEDGEWEDMDQAGDPGKSMPLRGGAFQSDFINRALPEPDYSVEEILMEEVQNRELRARRKGARVGEGEKDW